MSNFPFEQFAPVAAIVGFTGVIGWVYLERLKMKHGYPLEGSWGQKLDPVKTNDETVERLNSLTAENAALKSKLSDLEQRIRTLEKIATDPAHRLASEIEQLS
jgi:GDP-D-mannose dehydratase